MVNYLGTLIAAMVNIVVGMIWYHPKVFGDYTCKIAKLSKKDLKKGMTKGSILMIVSILVMVYVLDMFVKIAGANTALAGAQIGFLLWLGFIATVLIGPIFWGGKSVKLGVIYAGNYLISMILTGAILAAWK